MSGSDFLLALCFLSPCTEAGGVLHVPVPWIQPHVDPEVWPHVVIEGQRVRFTSFPRGT